MITGIAKVQQLQKRKKKRYQWLAHVINEQKYRIGAEVGAATGVTTKHILQHCPKLQKLIIVDLWTRIPKAGKAWDRDDMESIFRSKFENEKRLEIYKGISWEQASHIKNHSLDFVFIDAAHDFNSVANDIKAWESKVKPGGLLCGHDINLEGVYNAVNTYVKDWYVAGPDHVWFKIMEKAA